MHEYHYTCHVCCKHTDPDSPAQVPEAPSSPLQDLRCHSKSQWAPPQLSHGGQRGWSGSWQTKGEKTIVFIVRVGRCLHTRTHVHVGTLATHYGFLETLSLVGEKKALLYHK